MTDKISFAQSYKVRTLGDGMDRSELEYNENSASNDNFSIKIPQTPSHIILKTMRPVVPTSKIFKTIPKYVPLERVHPKYLTQLPKEPKFVPYEPYKCAVHPILSKKRRTNTHSPSKKSKNNVEIHHLVSQMNDLRTSELAKNNVEDEDVMITKKEWKQEKTNYENDIKNLRESNTVLENQLKLQTQVNSELKTLLVAAVGEDLETRVQHLTEDKLQLAKALLKSADHLTTNREQTEWLSGQCEVWRSKFLASSLMVEELARWKFALTKRTKELQSILLKILEDQKQITKKSIKTSYNLKKVSEHFGLNKNDIFALESANINILSNLNFEASCHLFDKFVVYNEEDFGKFYNELINISSKTYLEEEARKILQNPVSISSNQEALYKAVLGEADSAVNDQCLRNTVPHTTCCSHCIGEVKNI